MDIVSSVDKLILVYKELKSTCQHKGIKLSDAELMKIASELILSGELTQKLENIMESLDFIQRYGINSDQ